MLTNCLNLTDVLLYHFQFSHAFYELVARQRYRLNLKGSGSICCTRLANCSICDMFHPQPLWRLSAAMDIQNLWHFPPLHSRSHRVFDWILEDQVFSGQFYFSHGDIWNMPLTLTASDSLSCVIRQQRNTAVQRGWKGRRSFRQNKPSC